MVFKRELIRLKSKDEIKKMRHAGKLAAQTLIMIEKEITPGITTEDINRLCHEFILKNNAIPAPLNYNGFPKSVCTSVNDVVCHGIPDPFQQLEEGDIIGVDVTVILDGYHGDTCKTFCVGKVDQSAKLLIERTQQAMYKGIEAIKINGFLNDIGTHIDRFIRPFRYGIVRDFIGHGIGTKFHEPPHVFHHAQNSKGIKLKAGMTFTVEPMINMGDYRVFVDQEDNWTVYTKDHSLSAQFEHTIAITETGVEIMTLYDSN